MRKTIALLSITLTAFSFIAFKGETSALVGASFRPGQIIDDAIFTNKASMNVVQIQQFLDSKVVGGSCDTSGSRPSTRWNASASRYYTHAEWGALNGNPAPFVCLTTYRENRTTKQTNIGNPTGLVAGDGSQSAAEIIWSAAQQYDINPQTLLVLLQKEQSLITDDWPWLTQYQSATGAYCPDTAACDATKAGFGTQVYEGARLLRSYMTDPWLYFIGNNNVLYNPNRGCGSSTVNIQNAATAALYHYTPYQPNAAALDNLYGTGDACSAYGNRNFWRLFNDWFGSTLMPYAFKSANNPTIYLYVGGYKLVVPAMGIMQDYGISPASIQTVSQATIDQTPSPTPSDGVSTSISYIVKSPSDSDEDGGSIYLISVGKRYQIKSMQQFNDFGYSQSAIAYIPLSYINNQPNGGWLSNFIQSPNSSAFKVEGGQKKIIFQYSTYLSLNPSDNFTPVSYFITNLTPSGNPLETNVLVKYNDADAVYFYNGTNYRTITSYASYSCWGFNGALQTPLFRVMENSYIAPIVPVTSISSCLVNNGSENFLMDGDRKYSIPAAYGITTSAPSSDLIALINRLPTNSSPLKKYIKSTSAAAIWYLDGGARRVVPTYANYLLLGIGSSDVSIVGESAYSIPQSGIKLANGQPVKSDDSPVVFTVYQDKRVAYASSNDFLGYGNSWSAIETYPRATLDTSYPAIAQATTPYYFDTTTTKSYLIDQNSCYVLDGSLLASYGKVSPSIASTQPFDKTAVPGLNLNNCKVGSAFVKAPGQSTVYWLDAGAKHLISTWTTLVTKSGSSNPYVVTLSAPIVDSITTGTPLN